LIYSNLPQRGGRSIQANTNNPPQDPPPLEPLNEIPVVDTPIVDTPVEQPTQFKLERKEEKLVEVPVIETKTKKKKVTPAAVVPITWKSRIVKKVKKIFKKGKKIFKRIKKRFGR